VPSFSMAAARRSRRLARSLWERYGIVVVGTYAPPFRPLTEEEEREVALVEGQPLTFSGWRALPSRNAGCMNTAPSSKSR
jgi:hypothetical protein